jgi:hypothetical protein
MVAAMVVAVISAAAMVAAATFKHHGSARIHGTGVMER